MSKSVEEKRNIKQILENRAAAFNDRYIPDYQELKTIVSDLKKMGFRIVLTQGVYDLPHKGHYVYLEKAKQEGDILIVGIDSDELTRARKGPDRPIVPEDERLEMLVHIRHVDIVTVRRHGDDIGDLIRTVEPDVLIVSATTKDFTPDWVKQYKKEKICGKIVVLPAQATTSTSARIRDLHIKAGDKFKKHMEAAFEDYFRSV